MPYTFKEAINSLKIPERKRAKEDIKKILGITSDRQFDRIMRGVTPIPSPKITEVENELKKYGIVKIWD